MICFRVNLDFAINCFNTNNNNKAHTTIKYAVLSTQKRRNCNRNMPYPINQIQINQLIT